MAEIAEASELSLSTVFNYFPSKADIVFCVFDEILDGAEQRIASRRYGESGIRALGDWLRHVLPSLGACVSRGSRTRSPAASRRTSASRRTASVHACSPRRRWQSCARCGTRGGRSTWTSPPRPTI